MTAPMFLVALLPAFVECFTRPGFLHFQHFILAHAALRGAPHCVTETLRLTGRHAVVHWTAPYAFLKRGRWSCAAVARRLLALLRERLALSGPLVLALDDTLVKKWGRSFFGLGLHHDPTDKNPGASRRVVWGHCWVVLALLREIAPGRWRAFPLAALLFVPRAACPRGWAFATKIELAVRLVVRLCLSLDERVILVVDNLYAKGQLVVEALAARAGTLVSRLKTNAALYEPPRARRKGQRGRPAKRGRKVSARDLWRRRSRRRRLTVRIYGKTVTIPAFVGVVIPSRTLGDAPILVVIFPQRSGARMNVFFSTDAEMSPERLLELYGARFSIEEAFKELKTEGGFGDCRQRGFRALKRHATLALTAHSLLGLAAATLGDAAEGLETDPWWRPAGAPSVGRLRRACARTLGFCGVSWTRGQPLENPGPSARRRAAA